MAERNVTIKIRLAGHTEATRGLKGMRTEVTRGITSERALTTETKRAGQGFVALGGDAQRGATQLRDLSQRAKTAGNDLTKMERHARAAGGAMRGMGDSVAGGGGTGGGGLVGKLNLLMNAIPVVGQLFGSVMSLGRNMATNFLGVEKGIALAVGEMGVARAALDDYEAALNGSAEAAKKLGLSEEFLAEATKASFTAREAARTHLNQFVNEAAIAAGIDPKDVAGNVQNMTARFGLSLRTEEERTQLAEAITTTAQLSKLAGIDLRTATNTLASMMGATGMGARKSASLLLAAGAEGKLDPQQFEALAGFFAEQQGLMAPEKLTALIVAMSNVGVKPEEAISSLRLLEGKRSELAGEGMPTEDLIDFLQQIKATRANRLAGGERQQDINLEIRKLFGARAGGRALLALEQLDQIPAIEDLLKKRIATEIEQRFEVLAGTEGEKQARVRAVQQARVPVARQAIGGKFARAFGAVERLSAEAEAAITGKPFQALGLRPGSEAFKTLNFQGVKDQNTIELLGAGLKDAFVEIGDAWGMKGLGDAMGGAVEALAGGAQTVKDILTGVQDIAGFFKGAKEEGTKARDLVPVAAE